MTKGVMWGEGVPCWTLRVLGTQDILSELGRMTSGDNFPPWGAALGNLTLCPDSWCVPSSYLISPHTTLLPAFRASIPTPNGLTYPPPCCRPCQLSCGAPQWLLHSLHNEYPPPLKPFALNKNRPRVLHRSSFPCCSQINQSVVIGWGTGVEVDKE